MITGIMAALTAISSPVTAWVKGKAETKRIETHYKAKIKEAKVDAQIKRIQQGDETASDMDILSVKDRGWKDEYLLIVVTTPLILVFFPNMVSYIEEGFLALEKVPEWYMWILLGVFIDTFGFRRILRNTLQAYLDKRFNH